MKRVAALLASLLLAPAGIAAADEGDPGEILGTWRGTSTCGNRLIATACNDEVVLYEVRPADKHKIVTLKADKIVNAERVTMSELDFEYQPREGNSCRRVDFECESARIGRTRSYRA